IFNCRGQVIHAIDRFGKRMSFIYQGPWNPLTQNQFLSKIIDTLDREYIVESTMIGKGDLLTNFECRKKAENIPIPRLSKVTDFDKRNVVFNYESETRAILLSVVQEFGEHRLATRYSYRAEADEAYLLESIKAPR